MSRNISIPLALLIAATTGVTLAGPAAASGCPTGTTVVEAWSATEVMCSDGAVHSGTAPKTTKAAPAPAPTQQLTDPLPGDGDPVEVSQAAQALGAAAAQVAAPEGTTTTTATHKRTVARTARKATTHRTTRRAVTHKRTTTRRVAGHTRNTTLIRRERPAAFTVVTVQPGDTLTRIAREHDTTVHRIAHLNHIRNINRISAGDRLIVR